MPSPSASIMLGRLADTRIINITHASEAYEVKPSIGVRASAWLDMQSGKPWSHPWIQAGLSGSAFFPAGEAGIGVAEEEVLVSATMLKLS